MRVYIEYYVSEKRSYCFLALITRGSTAVSEFQSPHISKLRRAHSHISPAPRLSFQLIPRTSENLMLGPDHNCKVLFVFPNEQSALKCSVRTIILLKTYNNVYNKFYGGSRLLIVRVVGYVSFGMMTSSNGNILRDTDPLCGEFTGPGEFPAQRPVTRNFGVFFDRRLNKRLSKQPWGWWLGRHRGHYNVNVMWREGCVFVGVGGKGARVCGGKHEGKFWLK